MSAPKPKLVGYNAGYRTLLERRFIGHDHKERFNRLPSWVRVMVSEMLKEIENSHAREIEALKRRKTVKEKS